MHFDPSFESQKSTDLLLVKLLVLFVCFVDVINKHL